MSTGSFNSGPGDTQAVFVRAEDSLGILINSYNASGIESVQLSGDGFGNQFRSSGTAAAVYIEADAEGEALHVSADSGMGIDLYSDAGIGINVMSNQNTGIKVTSNTRGVTVVSKGEGVNVASDGEGVNVVSGGDGIKVIAQSAGVYATSANDNAIVGQKFGGLGAAGVFSNFSVQLSGKVVHINLGQAAIFTGHVNIGGNLFVSGAKGFRIDHPLSPSTKWLQHAALESPDLKNFYDGLVRLNDAGHALVELPEWFAAVNEDFRYQLTPIGKAAPNLFVGKEIDNNRFEIRGGIAGMKVSWQVTGRRKDTWAKAHPFSVEPSKSLDEKGTVIWPQKADKGRTVQSRLSPSMYRAKGDVEKGPSVQSQLAAESARHKQFQKGLKKRKK